MAVMSLPPGGPDQPTPAVAKVRKHLKVIGGRARAKTLPSAHLSWDERHEKEDAAWEEPFEVDRPKTRGDCEGRPCPSCDSIVNMVISFGENQDPGGTAVWNADRRPKVRVGAERGRDRAGMVGGMRLRNEENGFFSKSSERLDDELRMHSHETRDVRDAGIQGMGIDDPALHESQERELSHSRRTRNHRMRSMDEQLCGIPEGHGEATVPEARTGQGEQQRQLRARQLPLGDARNPDEEQANIACPNCGGRVRYIGGMDGKTWSWEAYDSNAPAPRLEPGDRGGYYRALNTCRPCGLSGCSHHLFIDVNPKTGAMKLNFPALEVWEMTETCSLDIADKGGVTLEEVGALTNLTRERVRQVQELCLEKIKRDDDGELGIPEARETYGSAPTGSRRGSP